MDSLFQEPSYDQYDQIEKNAYSTHKSPQGSSIATRQEDFYASHGFRSVVKTSTHQEIKQMLRLANPEVYEE